MCKFELLNRRQTVCRRRASAGHEIAKLGAPAPGIAQNDISLKSGRILEPCLFYSDESVFTEVEFVDAIKPLCARIAFDSQNERPACKSLVSIGEHHSICVGVRSRNGEPLLECCADLLFSTRFAAVRAAPENVTVQRIICKKGHDGVQVLHGKTPNQICYRFPVPADAPVLFVRCDLADERICHETSLQLDFDFRSVNTDRQSISQGSGMVKQEERKAATRSAVLKAAWQLFGQNGYTATSVDDIAAKAGVAKGAFYHHFPTKAALFEAVLEGVSARILAQVMEASSGSKTFWSAIDAGNHAFFMACTDRKTARILLHDGPAVLGWSRWREIDQRNFGGLLRQAFASAAKSGIVFAHDPDKMTRLVTGAVTEIVVHASEHEHLAKSAGEYVSMISAMIRGWQKRAK